MTPKQYAKNKLIDNIPTSRHYIGGKHAEFIALYGSIIECEISMEENRKNPDQFVYFYEAKCELVEKMKTFCILNKDLLITPPAHNDKLSIHHDLKA